LRKPNKLNYARMAHGTWTQTIEHAYGIPIDYSTITRLTITVVKDIIISSIESIIGSLFKLYNLINLPPGPGTLGIVLQYYRLWQYFVMLRTSDYNVFSQVRPVMSMIGQLVVWSATPWLVDRCRYVSSLYARIIWLISSDNRQQIMIKTF